MWLGESARGDRGTGIVGVANCERTNREIARSIGRIPRRAAAEEFVAGFEQGKKTGS